MGKKSTIEKVQEIKEASDQIEKVKSSSESDEKNSDSQSNKVKGIKRVIRMSSEEKFRKELDALVAYDNYPKPPNWLLSPKMVEMFISGTNEKFDLKGEKITITPKFFGFQDVVQKSIVTLASERSLMLIGEPGTGKSWLSELLAAAISGCSTYLIQGTAGTTEDQLRYTWNYALLIAEGPSERALVPSPTINAMKEGKILRVEELTRCPQEIQDSMISILSEKVLPVPELGKEYQISASQGFNVIATANDRDRGVNEMSAALKRRFNFIYIPVVNDEKLERKIVEMRVNDMMSRMNFKIQIPDEIYALVNTTFQELRAGKSNEGHSFKKISTVMSVSEEISLLFDCCLFTHFFENNTVKPDHLANNLCETVIKDSKENRAYLLEYLNLVLKPRANKKDIWEKFYSVFKKALSMED